MADDIGGAGYASAYITGPSNLGTPLMQILSGEAIEPGSIPSYELCKLLRTFHPLGQKLTMSPIQMAMFKDRELNCPDAPEDKVIRRFTDVRKRLKVDETIANVCDLARTYGVASLAVLTEGTPPNRPLNWKALPKTKFAFNVFDPLNTAGSLVLNQIPGSMDFMQPDNIRVSAQEYHKSRHVVMMNEQPIYLAYTTSSFGYVGRSVYQRCLFPLKSYIQTMQTDDLVSIKAGVIVAKIKQAGSIINNAMVKLFGLKREVVKAAANYGVISIGPEDEIESLNLRNIDTAITSSRRNILENIAVSADMPAKIINAETFVEGFGEGTEDAKNVARYIDRIRTWMQPLYDFTDQIVMYTAWDEDFFKEIQTEFPEYQNKTHAQAFFEWKRDFTAKWPDLLVEPESERAKARDVDLKALIATVQVFLPTLDPMNKAKALEWVADCLNGMKIFDTPLELDWEALADYEPPTPMADEKEIRAAPPFSMRDSQDEPDGTRALRSEIVRMIGRQ